MSRDYADPNCPKCGGAGFIYPECIYTRPGEKGGQYCDCALDALRLQNMDHIWKSLSQAKDVPALHANPPLKPLVERDLWITAKEEVFRAHLKAVAYSMSTMWECRVCSDSALLESWFGTSKAQGIRIYDLEIDRSTLEAIDLRDLVEPPSLLIVFLGVKHLPNKECPNALLEAISLRKHVGKPTWIVDQPDNQVNRMEHKFYSETLESWLARWPHVKLVGLDLVVARDADGGPQVIVDPEAADEIVEDSAESAVDEALSDMEDEDEKGSASDRPTSMLDDLAENDRQAQRRPRKSPRGRGGPRR